MPVDRDAFRQAMGLFPGAVTLITTGRGEGRRGITATAVCSVTDTPPTLLACVNRKTGTCAEILKSGHFSVQLLGADQTEIALTFAGAKGQAGAEKFDSALWSECSLGLPRVDGALASLSCVVENTMQSGSHQVFFGRIEGIHAGAGEALIYAQSRFRRLEAVA
ncbi:flavin reductase family protein [Pseudooceanicola sp. HF7]|uniref:flavin reductase family protein n=1 Tax=Pseudooceanicola sp. HF7 TaxID=2721560 RepID=UPI0014308357|nr:flavin reductase family protein [Pseudooceanicola sp. HF7]NIZ09347.1 flavin reductase family protein [Pseudooceanicola sp. HF7]